VTSPAHRQYLAIKQRYPDAILLFRMGDFYEMFEEDARIGAAKLQITLTSREFARGDRVPMAGIPHHALQSYLKRFIEHGLKVAICEQLTEPGKGLVERDVVRVVTPGTLVEPALLDAKRNNYLAALHRWKETYGLAYVDVTTGEFAVTEFAGTEAVAAVEAELLRLSPSECLVAEEPSFPVPGHVTVHDEFRFEPEGAREALCRHFGVRSLEGFGCAGLPAAVGAAGAILSYVERANRSLLGMLTGIRTYQVSAFMVLDRYTRKNLELTESARSGGVRGSLLWVLDATQTAMGGRLLRRFISQPLLDVFVLERRLAAVEEIHRLPMLRGQLRAVLAKIADLERLTGRVCQGSAVPTNLLGLRDSLRLLAEVLALLSGVESAELEDVASRIDPCADITQLIDRAVYEAGTGKRERRDVGSASAGEALIKPGYSEELDGMKASIRDSRQWIAHLEPAEQERTGIKSLKVGYNKVFGYYIEVSNANLGAVPPEYIRKQTLVNGERFITPDLKEHEARILQAEERIGSLERRIFADLLTAIGRESLRLFATAGALAHLDVYVALAEVAARHRYVRPDLTTETRLEIAEGRHPVVEVTLEDEGFIPNDCALDCEDRQIMLITGPNMGGKSTYLRQVALCVLLAQIGSFVPAERACIGLVDRIFTRVGAQDDIAAGQSTFMVEMVETANILHHATRRSLLLLDEIGRGTSTYDGLAIARAVVEHIHERVGARTLFATHYHELTALADRFPRIYNANVAVAEDSGQVVFLHRVVPGGADRSYGIHVARLAGLPPAVTERAEAVLQELEEKARQNGHRRPRRTGRQLPLFGEPGESLAGKVLDDLLALDVTGLTPIEALTRLHELQQKGRGC
jgi:DNA mismatch repair protein MutS